MTPSNPAPVGDEREQFPAVFQMHCPSGTTNACVKHARSIETLFSRMFGMRVPATAAPEGSQCDNCVNEAGKSDGGKES